MGEVVRGDGVVLFPDYSAACGWNLDPHGAVPGKEDRDPNNCLPEKLLSVVSLHLRKMP